MIAAAAAAAALWLGGPGGAPARADGLDFACDSHRPVVAEIKEPELAPPTQISADQIYQGEAENGDVHDAQHPPRVSAPALPGGGAQPTTNSGARRYLDFDSDGTNDITYGFGLRASTGPGPVPSQTGPSPLDTLFKENFGFRADWPNAGAPAANPVATPGLDLWFALPQGSKLVRDYAGQYRATFGVVIRFRLADGTTTVPYDIRVHVDALPRFPGDTDPRLPDEGRISLVFKQRYHPDGFPIFRAAVGQEFRYEGLGAKDPRPGLAVGVTMDQAQVPDQQQTPTREIDVNTRWDDAPEDFAIGISQWCPRVKPGVVGESLGQIAWARTSPAARTSAVDVDIRTGIGGGIRGADEIVVDGRFDAVPERLDWVMRPEQIDLVRSNDVGFGFTLDRLQLAGEDLDPATLDTPLLAEGGAEQIPTHVRAQAGFDGDGNIRAGRLETCPRVGARDDLRDDLPNLTRLLSGDFVSGCDSASPPEARRAQWLRVVAQNFLPDDPAQRNATAGLPEPPPAKRRAGQECELVSRGPDQPMKWVCTNTPEVPQTSFLLYGTRDVLQDAQTDLDNRGFYRFGADLNEVDTVDFALDSAPSANGGVATELEGSAVLDTAQLAQVLVRADGRTHSSGANNRGTDIGVEATLEDLPTKIRTLRYRADSDPKASVPLEVTWEASDPIAISDGSAHVELPAVDDDGAQASAVVVDGVFDVGAAGGRLPRAVTLRQTRSEAPDGATTTYEYLGSDPVRLALGGLVSTRDDRAADRVLRVHGDLHIGPDVSVAVTNSDTNDPVPSIDVDACPNRGQCTNDVSVTATYGEPRPGPDLRAAPPLPPAPVGAPGSGYPHPEFTDWAGRRGVTAVTNNRGLGPDGFVDDWGVAARVDNIMRASYGAERQELCLETRPMGDFAVNVYDHGSGLYADGVLDRLPAGLFARFSGDESAGEPLVWITTDGCGGSPPIESTRPSTVNAEPTPSTQPLFDGIVRKGVNLGNAAANLPVAGDGTRPTEGVDFVTNGTDFHARAEFRLPRHVLVWAPEIESCSTDLGLFPFLYCAGVPVFDGHEWQAAQARVQSTSQSLGDLHVEARVGDFDVVADVATLPAGIDGEVRIDTYRTPPWTDLSAEFDANAALGEIHATLDDRTEAAFVGDAANRTPANTVPEYRIDLTDVGDAIDLDARLRPSDDPDGTPEQGSAVGEPVCVDATGQNNHPNAEREGPEGIEYVHAALDLNQASDLDVLFWSGEQYWLGSGELAEHERQTAIDFSSDEGVDGTVTTKLADLAFYRTEPSPANFEACLQFDLPIELTLVDATGIRLGHVGAKLSLQMDDDDRNDADGDGTNGSVTGRIGETFTCTSRCHPSSTVGVPEWRAGSPRTYHFADFDPLGPGDWTEQWDMDATTGPMYWHSVGIIPLNTPQTYRDRNCEGHFCYTGRTVFQNDINPARLWPTHWLGYEIAEFVIDPLFDAVTRMQMYDRDRSIFPRRPGAELYSKLAELGSFPTLYSEPLPPTQASLDSMSRHIGGVEGSGLPGFCQPAGWETPKATGLDGTRYSVMFQRVPDYKNLPLTGGRCRAFVIARLPWAFGHDNNVRWVKEIPGGVRAFAYKDDREYKDVDIDPRGDGSVEVHLVDALLDPFGRTQIDREVVARLDASGNGEFKNRRNFPFDSVATQGCTHGHLQMPGLPPPDGKRLWFFGDGHWAHLRSSTGPNHCYDLPGAYWAQVIDFDAQGNILQSKGFEVAVTL